MFVKKKIVTISNLCKKKILIEQDLDLDLTILLFNEWKKMLPIHIFRLRSSCSLVELSEATHFDG